MALGKKKINKSYQLQVVVEEVKKTTDTNRYNALFIELIDALRPAKHQAPEANLQALLDIADQDAELVSSLQDMFVFLFNTRDSQSLLTDVGILNSGTFFSELLQQIRHRLLPPLPEKRSMYYLLEKAFHKKNDFKWVAAIPDSLWIGFFKIAAGGLDKADAPFQQYLVNALTILSYRVAALGLQNELNRHIKTKTEFASPFIEQNVKIQDFITLIQEEGEPNVTVLHESALVILEQFDACLDIIQDIRNHTGDKGTSLGQSYVLLRTSQQLMRMRLILRFLTLGDLPGETLRNSVLLFENIIESINKRYSISDLYKKNSAMLAYQVAEHKSASGEHYISTTRPEYESMFYAAAAGGVIIAIAAVIKALLHMVHMAPFWQYFFYSFNYAVAFVILFITGASLATKQPTMTASALASSLDTRKGGTSLQGLALTFAKVWRSQFASFAGNLIVVFPLAYLLSVLWELLSGIPLLQTPEAAQQALDDQNPLKSLAWFYACITGVCLFLSGIITGYVDNKVIYGNIETRLKEHSLLRKLFRANSLNRLASYTKRHLGGICGNVALGFMLGYAQLFGDFFGIPFDIRHITISTAYFGFGVNGLSNQLTTADWVWTTIGVIGIGFFNFAVSFGLAFYVALRSRSVPLTQVPHLARLIWKFFLKYPQDFLFPPKKERKESEVFDK